MKSAGVPEDDVHTALGGLARPGGQTRATATARRPGRRRSWTRRRRGRRSAAGRRCRGALRRQSSAA
eukprot:2472244-Pyramimonas_sp.AAC.1